MKKFVVMAAAAGALAVGGAASAQDLGSVLGSIFGYGTPQYGASSPAVVAGSVPYGSQVYIDQYGRQVYIDQWGRQVLVQQQQPQQTIIGYDQWGRPVYGTTSYGAYGGYSNHAYSALADRDGDGVSDRFDRYPHDWRYR